MRKQLFDLGQTVGATLKERRETLGVVESSAGGLISAALLAVPGASTYFVGGTVVYTHEARRTLLGISDDQLKDVRPSSEPYVKILSEGLRRYLEVDRVLAESGATGPTGNAYGDAAGHVVLAVAGQSGTHTKTIEMGHSDREANMWSFAIAGLEMLRGSLKL